MKSSEDNELGLKGWIAGPKPKSRTGEPSPGPAILDKHRIAVLPFDNISRDIKDEYFADGITEELISALSRISGLRVIARTSVMKYKGTNKGISEIAQELRTGTVLEGSVRKFENRLRANVQLIDATSEEHLWAQTFDRDFKDIFEIQSDIAGNVAEALKIRLNAGEGERLKRVPTENMEAYTLYLRGREIGNERTGDALRKAIGFFEKAIEKDSKYAKAYAGLADSYLLLGSYGYVDHREVLPKAKTAAMRALGIDPALAEAHVSCAWVFWNEYDIEGARSELRKALELNPSYAIAHHRYSINLVATGNMEEAMVEAKRARDLDPLSPILSLLLGAVYISSRQYEKAVEELKGGLEVFPDYWNLHAYLGTALIGASRYEEGISELKKALSLSDNSNVVKSSLAVGYALSGRRNESNSMLSELIELSKKQYISPVDLAEIHLGLGNKEEALRLLEMAYEQRSGGVLIQSLTEVPIFADNLGRDPRFLELLRKIGLKDQLISSSGGHRDS